MGKRYAVVSGLNVSERVVARYLPGNYQVVEDSVDLDGTVLIEGEDDAGWTLDGYVIPRLLSGFYGCKEQFVHCEDVGDAENGPRLSTWLEDEPQSAARV